MDQIALRIFVPLDVRQVRKLRFIIGWGLLSLLTRGYAQSNCDELLDLQVGTQWTYQWYDTKDKPTFRTQRLVLSREMSADSSAVESRVAMSIQDALGDTTFQKAYRVTCTAAGLYEDILAKLTPEMLSAFHQLELQTEERGWLLPRRLAPDSVIPPFYSRIQALNNGVQLAEVDLALGPVRVLAQEDLTTPAGGFPCVALAYELWITTTVRKRFLFRDWYSPRVGVIRREVFGRNGRYFGYCELMRYAPPD